MTEAHRKRLTYQVAQLRHAYSHLILAGTSDFAKGLIGSAIKTIEDILRETRS